MLLGGAALSLLVGLPAAAQVAQNDAARLQAVAPRGGAPSSFADLTQALQPAVVNISSRQKVKVDNQNPFTGTPFEGLFGGQEPQQGQSPQTREARSLGSGFIISADGFLVTNNHVITADGQGEVESITVTLPDGSEFPAKVIGRDAASDLAVLKIDAGRPLPFVKFGDSRGARVGDWVIAIGNPFGLGGTVTAGIISAVYRNTGTGGAYDRYLQTDAAINRGNSGGPMFDMKGQVIGINNAIFSPNGGSIGIGFAIPADTAAPIVERLMKGQAIERGYLGIRIQPLNDDMADSLGLAHNRGEFVQSVEPGKAASKAGILPGDVVVKVAGHEVSPEQTLSYLVANIAPGTTIPLEVIRSGQHLTLNATVSKRPSEEELAKQSFDPDQPGDAPLNQQQHDSSNAVEKELGFSVVTVTPQIARQLGVAEDLHGVVIGTVDASSDAGAKGLQRGDIVLSANNHPVASSADLDREIRAVQAAKRSAVLLQVLRRGQPVTYLPVRLK
jgi:serine protease Do